MADVGEIRARLILNSTDFTRGMQQARGQMEQTNRSAERTSKAVDKIHKASWDSQWRSERFLRRA
jgi:hypothetical protein